jgi:CDP-diacylglycerol pyrophosphatase
MTATTPIEETPAETRRRRRLPAAAVLVCAVWAAVLTIIAGPGRSVAAHIDDNALWQIVHGLCVVDEQKLHLPAPCAVVDIKDGEADGFAILKDLIGKTQFLLIPTRRLAGIEDPLIGTDAVPNYWRDAWTARQLVSQNAGKELPREDIGMAINGAGARTQDQLHIHVDCVRADVRAALQAAAPGIGEKWADFQLLGHLYRARRIMGDNPAPDPFRLLAGDPRLAPLRDDALAVIGVSFPGGAPGFVLLAQQAPGGKTHPETLLDHKCAVAE